MSVAVSGPWDGSAFQNERATLKNTSIISEYKYEYPIKMLERTKAIKPNSSQDWATMGLTDGVGTSYNEVYKPPVGLVKPTNYKPKHKPNTNAAKMDSVTNYRGDFTGKLTDRPKQIRPRSAHRDNTDNTCFYDDTTAGKSYRKYSEVERKSARLRIKRLGSTHGHIDIKNPVKFGGGGSTHHADYQKLPFERTTKIVPADNNLQFGLEAGDNETSYRMDYAPIIGGTRQEPIIPPISQKLQQEYDGPSVSTHTRDYTGHLGTARTKAFLPDRSYRPSTAPCDKQSSYSNSYKSWGIQKKGEMPWAEMAKKRTTLHNNAYNEIPTSNYMVDFRNGNTMSKREAIKPALVTWSDRPPFEAESQYKERFRGVQTGKVQSYKPVRAYSKPSEALDGTSTAHDSFRGTFALPPKPCRPAHVSASTDAAMDSMTEYRYRFH